MKKLLLISLVALMVLLVVLIKSKKFITSPVFTPKKQPAVSKIIPESTAKIKSLEGTVLEISDNLITVKATTGLPTDISSSSAQVKNVQVLLTSSTEVFKITLFDSNGAAKPEQENRAEISDLKKGDHIVVFIEGNSDSTLKALKVDILAN